MTGAEESRGRFLFRSDQGRIDAATWRLHAGWLIALALVLTIGWLLLRPNAHHDLKTQAFIQPATIVAFSYLILYSFALLLIAICYTMLSIKRLRDRGLPTRLAGLVPLLVLFAASLHFLREQTPDVIVLPYVIALDILLLAAVAWSVVDLGFGRPSSRAAQPPPSSRAAESPPSSRAAEPTRDP